jgi:hypothetical protein
MRITLTATIDIDSSKTDDEIFNSVMKTLSDRGILDLKDKLEKISKELDIKSNIQVTSNSTKIESNPDKPAKRKYVRRKPIVNTDKKESKFLFDLPDKKPIVLKANESICHNAKCKKPFKVTEFNQKYCSVKCEAEVLSRNI